MDGAASGVTKGRHGVTFPLLTQHHGKDRVHFSTGFIQNKTLSIPAVLQIFHYIRKIDEILSIENFAFDA
jgi:hypothetical protein